MLKSFLSEWRKRQTGAVNVIKKALEIVEEAVSTTKPRRSEASASINIGLSRHLVVAQKSWILKNVS